MSAQRKEAKGRSVTNAAVNKVMSTLMQFERKLDKLQDDVSFHGQALTELKTLMSTISTANAVVKPDGKGGDCKRSPNRKKMTTAIQYDHMLTLDQSAKTRRKQAIQPLPSKLQTKNVEIKGASADNGGRYRMNNKASSPRTGSMKYAHNNATRPSKAEAPRKATTLITVTQKAMPNLTNNPVIKV